MQGSACRDTFCLRANFVLQRRLGDAAKKAISKLQVRTIRKGDKVIFQIAHYQMKLCAEDSFRPLGQWGRTEMAIAYLAAVWPSGRGGVLVSNLQREWSRGRRWFGEDAENPASWNMLAKSACFPGQVSSRKRVGKPNLLVLKCIVELAAASVTGLLCHVGSCMKRLADKTKNWKLCIFSFL